MRIQVSKMQMKYNSILKQDIKAAKDPDELFLIHFLRDFKERKKQKKDLVILQDLMKNSINFKLLQKAFPKEKDLEDFLEFSITKLKPYLKNSIPWDNFPKLLDKCFRYIPSKYRTENACLKYIKEMEKINCHSYNLIPKKILRESKPLINLFLYRIQKQELIYGRSYLVNSIFADTYEANKELWCDDDANFLLYLHFRVEAHRFHFNKYWTLPSHPFDYDKFSTFGFNSFPKKIQKSKRIRRALIPNLKDLTINEDVALSGSEKEHIADHWNTHTDYLNHIDGDFIASLNQAEAEDILEIVIKLHSLGILINTFTLAFIQSEIKKLPFFYKLPYVIK